MPNKIEIGREMYLHTISDSGKSAPSLLISSHGGFGLTSGKVTVPAWTRLWFYAPHKMVLTDPGLGSVIEGKAVPCEFAEPGDPVNDYVLSKFQSKKAGGESYGSIQSTLGQAAVKSTHNQGVSQFSAEERQKRGYIVYPKDIIEKYQEYDILTIRNRRFTPDPKLSDVLSRLFTHNRKYANIHCSFCRVSTWAIRYESWDAETWTAS